MPSQSSEWSRRRAIENGLAILADLDLDTDCLITHVQLSTLRHCDRSIKALVQLARTFGHGPILTEVYQLRSHFGELKLWLVEEWLASLEDKPCTP